MNKNDFYSFFSVLRLQFWFHINYPNFLYLKNIKRDCKTHKSYQ